MPMPATVDVTLQAALMSVLSSVIAQYLQSLKQGVELNIDYIPVMQFILFSIFITPPNFLWQSFLESTWPAKPSTAPAHPKKSDEKATEPKLSIRNTIIKLLLDQTLGAAFNTIAFSLFNRTLQQAMAHAPVEHSIFKAIGYWNSGGALDFSSVDFAHVWQQSKDEFLPIIVAGWKLWPLVSVVNFTMVSDVQTRNLVGGVAGLGWGTYMSMKASGAE